MINKKSLWFLTLFSLILVLSIYYITMPSELLLTTNKENIKEEKKVMVMLLNAQIHLHLICYLINIHILYYKQVDLM